MDINNNNLIFFLLVSIILNLFVINFSKPISKKLALIDKPDKTRKHHKKVTPLIASLSIVIFLFICLVYNFFYTFIVNKDFIIIFISSLAVFVVGVFDDRFDLSPIKKIILISLISYFAITLSDNLLLTKFYISTYDTFFYTNFFSIFFTILCLLTLINSFNLIDGINGLSIGVIIIWFVSFLIIYDYQLKFFSYDKSKLFFLIIILNLLTIFYFNIKNFYFLGDSGALFLSYLFGMLIIKSTNENYSVGVGTYVSAEQILVLFFIPFIDMLRLMISRIKNKKSPFEGDRNHFHHYILNFTKNKNLTIFIYFIYVIFPILLTIIFKNLKIELIIIASLLLYILSLKLIKNSN